MIEGCGPAIPRFAPREITSREHSGASQHQLEGMAPYYADEFDGRKTSSGEVFDMLALTAAHRTLPFDTIVRVVNLENNRSVVVRVNDRGPFKSDRVIDVSFEAAKQLGLIANGTAPVRIEVLELGTDSN